VGKNGYCGLIPDKHTEGVKKKIGPGKGRPPLVPKTPERGKKKILGAGPVANRNDEMGSANPKTGKSGYRGWVTKRKIIVLVPLSQKSAGEANKAPGKKRKPRGSANFTKP